METANLKCPYCKEIQKVGIPETGCLALHICKKCKKVISVPRDSKNCCVICEYADRMCPTGKSN